MGNQFQSTSTGLGILKNFYQGPLQDQFNEETPIWKGAQKGTYPWSGLQVNRPLKVRRNQGIGATSDGGLLPKVGSQGTVQAVILPKYNYLRFGVTGPMLMASKSDVGSFVRDAKYELTEGYNDMRSDCNRQLSWDGTGDLARVNTTVVGSNSVVLKGREDTEPALKFVDVGTVVDIYSGTTLVQAGLTISSLTSGDSSSATATVVFDSAVTATANTVLVRANSFGFEIQGLMTQLDGATTTVFSVDRSQYLQSQGNVIYVTTDGTSSGSSIPLSLQYLQQAEDAAGRRGGPGVNALYSDYASRAFYIKLLQADKRYVNSMKGDGGFADKEKSYVDYNGKAWIPDKDCPTRIYFLPDKQIEKYTLADMEFADETGSMWIAGSENDQLEGRIRFFANLFNSKAAGSSVVQSYISP